jgi:hypothetical protein
MVLDLDDIDSVAVFRLVKTLKEIRNGSREASDHAYELHEMLCNSDGDSNGKAFTRFYEQQDSHDLMFYFLDKITMVTAKFAR